MVSHTNEVLFNLEQIPSEIRDAENFQRGYLVSGNEDFLKGYWGGYEKTMNRYDEVKKLMKANVSQQMRLDTLMTLINKRFDELEQRYKLGLVPLTDPRPRQMALDGVITMDKIVGLVDRMESAEQELMKHRQRNAEEAADNAFVIAGVFTVLTILIIIISFAFTLNEFQRRSIYEKKLNESMETLKLTNENLEQFAYVASHDLQEPLRKIRAFGDLLKADYADSLPEQASDYIGRMHNAAERMQVLINDLLNFSRASRNVGEYEIVVLREKIMNVMDDLEITIKESNTQIDLDLSSEYSIYGNRPQLARLFQNLISNAIKFQKEGVDPIIRIVGKQYDSNKNVYGFNLDRYKDYVEIDIIDNGIGFDEQYKEKIFTIFQRLHGRMDFKGTGIGLALCKKIVENHNGFITVKSKPDEGSTFIIILPIKQG